MYGSPTCHAVLQLTLVDQIGSLNRKASKGGEGGGAAMVNEQVGQGRDLQSSQLGRSELWQS